MVMEIKRSWSELTIGRTQYTFFLRLYLRSHSLFIIFDFSRNHLQKIHLPIIYETHHPGEYIVIHRGVLWYYCIIVREIATLIKSAGNAATIEFRDCFDEF